MNGQMKYVRVAKNKNKNALKMKKDSLEECGFKNVKDELKDIVKALKGK